MQGTVGREFGSPVLPPPPPPPTSNTASSVIIVIGDLSFFSGNVAHQNF